MGSQSLYLLFDAVAEIVELSSDSELRVTESGARSLKWSECIFL
jgi:hypothetical protein